MKRIFYLIPLFSILTVILSGCSIFKFTTWITFAPNNPATTGETLTIAQKVLQERLNMTLSGEASVQIKNNRLRVGLTDENDLPITTELATTVGAFVFFHSLEPIESGKPVPSDVWIILTDSDVETASINLSTTDQYWSVDFIFTPEGTDKLADYSQSHIGAYLVIAQDNVVIMSPLIGSTLPGGEASLSGQLDQETAEILAAKLNSGRLPVQLVVEK